MLEKKDKKEMKRKKKNKEDTKENTVGKIDTEFQNPSAYDNQIIKTTKRM